MSSGNERNDKVVVLQSIGAWLAHTMVWLYDQVTSLGPGIENHVVCEQLVNLKTFDVPNITSLSAKYPLRSKLDRTLRKAGLTAGLPIKRRVLRESGASLLHSHFGNYGWGDMEIAGAENAGHIVTFYGVDVNKMPQNDPRWFERYKELFRRADRFLCEGPHMASCLVAMGCPPEKVTVHHLGVRISEIRCELRRYDATKPLRVLLCASFVEKKGLPYAIRALGDAARDIPLTVTLIGGSTGNPEHAPENDAIHAAIAESGLGDRLTMAGFQPYSKLIEAAYEHDVFLSPSVTAHDGDTEGGAPVTIAVMAAAGIPIVATTHCDIPEIVQHGKSALLAPERDAGALAAHLRWLVNNPDRWPEFGQASRDRMVREFDCEKQGLKLAQIYSDLDRSRRRKGRAQ